MAPSQPWVFTKWVKIPANFHTYIKDSLSAENHIFSCWRYFLYIFGTFTEWHKTNAQPIPYFNCSLMKDTCSTHTRSREDEMKNIQTYKDRNTCLKWELRCKWTLSCSISTQFQWKTTATSSKLLPKTSHLNTAKSISDSNSNKCTSCLQGKCVCLYLPSNAETKKTDKIQVLQKSGIFLPHH